MARDKGNELPEEERRGIFLALVEAQDTTRDVAESRKTIAGRFGITGASVKRIEEEGLDAGWPPLD